MERAERAAKVTMICRTSIAAPTFKRRQPHTIRKHENDNETCCQLAQSVKKHTMPIVFSEEDDGVQFLHDDAVVILNVGNYNVHRILIDNGSSALRHF